MWMALGFFCMLGIAVGVIGAIVLAIKKSPRWKIWLAGSGVALVLLIVAAVNSPKTPHEQVKGPANSMSVPSAPVNNPTPESPTVQEQKTADSEVLKKQREAFNTWLYQYNEYSKRHDAIQQEVLATLDSLTKGNASPSTISPSRNEAYIKLTKMYQELSSLRIDVYNLKPPTELSPEHQERLKTAGTELHSAVSSTDSARRYMKKYLETMNPSDINWANNSAQNIKTHLDLSTAQVNQVKKDLGF